MRVKIDGLFIIGQYSLDGKFIKVWDFASDIEDELGIKSDYVLDCCNGKRNRVNDFIFNKIYDSKNIPQRINSLFTKRNSKRGELPIGVTKTLKYKTFSSTVSINGKNITKRFETAEEAFQDYKFRKEKEIKRVADLYKDKIPTKLYEAMYNYKVEITD